MHIAVCDDNIADRKQLERLLKRESDKRKNDSGLIYTDSFGDSEVLSRTPMQYDLFFVDLTEDNSDGLALALSLIQNGVKAPIVLCSSKINYLVKMQTLSPCPANLMHLHKPIKTAELSQTIDKALALLEEKVPTIELRSETETYYVTEDDIVYAVSVNNYVHVHLRDERVVIMLTNIYNFFDQISMYTHMVWLNDHSMFNIAYLQHQSAFRIMLSNGVELKSSPFASKRIKSALQKYLAETP